MKSLIVTADDVGLHRGMTEGAIAAHESGIVTACSIVANGAAFDHAVERLRSVPSLALGVHLTLVEERPLAAVPSLVGQNGLFHQDWMHLVPRYYARLIDMDDVEREFRMQIERVSASGLQVTHLNGHQHLHLLPRVFDVVLRLADEYGIGYIRIVDEPSPGRAVRALSIRGLSHLGREARRKRGPRGNQRTIGVGGAGAMTAESLIALLDQVDGVTELVTHPGIGEDELRAAYDWGYAWEAETASLTDPEVRDAITRLGIVLAAP